MRKPPTPPTPPTAAERAAVARTFSHDCDGAIVSLSPEALKQIAIHRRDAVSANRRERRRMAAILRSDRVQARVNKAIQRQLDKVEKRAPPPKIRVFVDAGHRRPYKRSSHRITPRSRVSLPAYDGPIIDRQGRRGIVMTIEYDGAKRHAFGIMRRRLIYISDPEHCEIDAQGNAVFFSNMGADLAEILTTADLVELTQRVSRVDAKLDVNIIIQMPHDVPQETRAAILKAISHELFGRHGLPYAAALHEPDPNGDQRNFHGHICASWRPVTRISPYCWEVVQDLRCDLDGAQYWRHARRRAAEIMTTMVQCDGLDRQYTHLSNAERGLVHKPQKKLDKRKTRDARQGEFVADVEANRRQMAANVALEKKLEEGRQQRHERALKRKLAVLAKVEWSVLGAPKLQPVRAFESSRFVAKVRAIDAESRSDIRVISATPLEVDHKHAAIAIKAAPATRWAGLAPVRNASIPSTTRSVDAVVESGASDISFGRIARRNLTAGTEARIGHTLSKLTPVRGHSRRSFLQFPAVVGRVETAPLRLLTVPIESGDAPGIGRPVATALRQAPAQAVDLSDRAHAAVLRLEAVSSTPKRSPSIRKINVSFSGKGTRATSLGPVFPAGGSLRPDTSVQGLSALIPPPKALPRPLVEVVDHSSNTRRVAFPLPSVEVATARPGIRQVGVTYSVASTSRLRAVTVGRLEDRGQDLLPVAAADDPAIGSVLREAVAKVGALVNQLATALERIGHVEAARDDGSHENHAQRVGGAVHESVDISDEAAEVAAARAFVLRVRNKAIHVVESKSGLVVPHRIYWGGNGLTGRGLRDPGVQEDLARMRQHQVDYMNRITPILQAHVDAGILRKGRMAMVEALPEDERAAAGEWARTGIWDKAMEWLVEDGHRRSRLALKRWKKACANKAAERFAEAAKALRQHEKWPLDVEPCLLAEIKSDAKRHAQSLAAQQTNARQQGMG